MMNWNFGIKAAGAVLVLAGQLLLVALGVAIAGVCLGGLVAIWALRQLGVKVGDALKYRVKELQRLHRFKV